MQIKQHPCALKPGHRGGHRSAEGVAKKKAEREANRERERATSKRHYETHKEAKREYYVAHKEEILERERLYRIANLDEFRKKDADYYASHREEKVAYARNYRKDHKETRRAYLKAYYEDNISKFKAARRKRRGLIEATYSEPYTRNDIIRAWGVICYLCDNIIPDDWHFEHVIPLAVGGKDTVGNVRPACPKCNHKKHASTNEIFILAHYEFVKAVSVNES